jgi:predicted metal-dependent hydrolase
VDIKKIELFKTSTKTISYQEIGDITYKRNSRARRLSISINRSSGVKVTIPGTLSFRSAETFVLSKSAWIIEKIDHFKKTQIIISPSEEFKTRRHALLFEPADVEKITVKIRLNKIIIIYPESLNVSDELVQVAAKKGIENAYRLEAKEILPQRVDEIAGKYGFKYNKIGIKRSTSRWGSCSARNNINLSLFLMKLPDMMVDYIILHELCHTVHKNHGPKFWAALDKLTDGKAKSLSKQVRRYKAGI